MKIATLNGYEITERQGRLTKARRGASMSTLDVSLNGAVVHSIRHRVCRPYGYKAAVAKAREWIVDATVAAAFKAGHHAACDYVAGLTTGREAPCTCGVAGEALDTQGAP